MGVKFSLSRFVQNLPKIIRERKKSIREKRKRKNTEEPGRIDDEVSRPRLDRKISSLLRNLTGIRLEILEKGVRVILVESSCLPFNGNHREKLRGPRWLRTNVRCVAKERSERKKNERRTRKDRPCRMILEFAASLPLEIVLRPLENDGENGGGLSLNPGDGYAYVGSARPMTNWIIILLGN